MTTIPSPAAIHERRLKLVELHKRGLIERMKDAVESLAMDKPGSRAKRAVPVSPAEDYVQEVIGMFQQAGYDVTVSKDREEIYIGMPS